MTSNVVGFDNIALSAIVDPGLTTVAAPLRAMGIIGVENLIATIGGATPSRDPLVLPAKLLVRGSTGPRRRNGISPVLPTTKGVRVFLEDGAVNGDPVEVAELGWAAHLHLCPSPGSRSCCF
jgi:hypothetical protein